jgi:glutamine amidotransferase
MSCERPEDVVSVSTYGHEFASSIGRENILGVQFHPEKSHYDGFELVKRFAEAEGAPE